MSKYHIVGNHMLRLILFQIINRFDVDFFRIYTAQNEDECGVKLEHDTEYILTGTVNSEIFARILFSRIALKHIFATLKTATRA